MKRKPGIGLLSIAVFTVTYAVNLQVPLYSEYAANSAVGATAMTFAFAAYVAGLMPTLMFFGGLSDRIGRRLPIFAALCLGALATLILILSPTWAALIVARFMLGVSTALATTAGTAYMTELFKKDDTRQATLLITSATSLGFGSGALATGISLSLLGPSFMPISFVVLLMIAPFLALAVLLLPRSQHVQQERMLRLPVFPAGTWQYGVALALAWSATSMTIAVVPLQLEQQGLGEYTGLVVFLAIFVGFLCQPAARHLTNRKSLTIGFVLVPFGFMTLLAGLWSHAIWLVLAGTAITSSASYGFTYLASLAEFSMLAPDNRARAAAGLFTYAYVGFSLPTIASGALADTFGLLPAMVAFAGLLLVVTIAVVAIGRREATSHPVYVKRQTTSSHT